MAIELRCDFTRETLWATQAQIANVFDIERSVATKRIRNILKDQELNEKSVCAKFATTALDEKSNVQKMHNANGGSIAK